MFVQSDFLMRQIEMISAGIARLVASDTPGDMPDDAEVVQAAGLGLDIAESLPPSTVAGLVEHDTQRLLMLGLALGRRAWMAGDRQQARVALRLIHRAGAVGTLGEDAETVRGALESLAFG